MNICFYNMNHIGDVYFTSFFLNILCNQNKNVNFYFYTINGDYFLEHIKNLNRIYPIENEYSGYLINGNAPEKLLNSNILNVLVANKMENIGAKILNINNKKYLFINTWASSNYLHHSDFELHSGINAWNNCISRINQDFGLTLKFDIININDLIPYHNLEYINNDFFEDTVFIFNFKPRSIPYNMESLNKFIINISNKNKVILSSYNKLFDNNENIKFVDKDYNIYPTPNCKNLIQMWEIAIKCKKIILMPTGGAWTFFHKLKQIKNNQMYMLNHEYYCKILNININLLLQSNINLIENLT